MSDVFLSEAISEFVWNTRYRCRDAGSGDEVSVAMSWERVAVALSKPEEHHRDDWRDRFTQILSHFRFLPGGRILAEAGSGRRTTMFNCFVTGVLNDTLEGIFSALGESMLAMQAGGGIGCDFSTLRPAGVPAVQSGGIASGPVSFMHLWESACATLLSTRMRRGAMMATLRCDHPDIEAFIDAKRGAGALLHFNLSVLISDAFMQAVDEDGPWPLVFPLAGHAVPPDGVVCERQWSGAAAPEPCLVANTVRARTLWERIARAAHDCGDPGVVFIDRVQRANNLRYIENISACNPCGEVPLPPHGACNLGSINLTQFVQEPFGKHPRLGLQGIAGTAAVATRLLDNVYEASSFPLKAQAAAAHASRRIGIGITGLADALAMLGVLRLRPFLRYRRCAHANDHACRLARFDRPRRRTGGVPRLSGGRISGRRFHPIAAERDHRRYLAKRYSQQPPERDRAGGHHPPAGKQCLERHRACLRFRAQTQGAGRRRKRRREARIRLCLAPVSAIAWPAHATAFHVRRSRRRRTRAPTAADVTSAGSRRSSHFQDDQLAGRGQRRAGRGGFLRSPSTGIERGHRVSYRRRARAGSGALRGWSVV